MSVATFEAPSAVRRVLEVGRIQSVNAMTLIGLPLGVLAAAFAVNLAIFAAIGGPVPPGGRVTGALMSIYIVIGVTHLQTMTQVFPFALGLSVTRRAFYAGTALVVVVQAAVLGVALTVFAAIETATGGWGIQLQFFGLGFLRQGNPFLQWLVYTVPFLALAAIFVFMGGIFKRWGQTGVWTVSIGSGLVLGAVAVLVTWLRLWPVAGEFFVGQSTFALLAGYPLVIAVVLGAAGYLVIRRATP